MNERSDRERTTIREWTSFYLQISQRAAEKNGVYCPALRPGATINRMSSQHLQYGGSFHLSRVARLTGLIARYKGKMSLKHTS